MMRPRGAAATTIYSPNGAAATELIRIVTASTFENLISKGAGPIVVEFMSYECGHCRTFEPIYQEVAAALVSEVRCFRVDVTVDQALAETYQITGTPTLVIFSQENEVGRAEGSDPSVLSLLTSIRQPFES